MMVRPIIDWRSWSFGRGPISSTKARHHDDDSRTCHLEYDVIKSREKRTRANALVRDRIYNRYCTSCLGVRLIEFTILLLVHVSVYEFDTVTVFIDMCLISECSN